MTYTNTAHTHTHTFIFYYLQLKQEFAAMGSNFAAERSALQRQVNNSDDRIRKMEEMNKLEIENVKREGQVTSCTHMYIHTCIHKFITFFLEIY